MWQYNKPGTLTHHGILGQKWGIRRFQNKDGTLTEKGIRRYQDKNGRLTKEGQKNMMKTCSVRKTKSFGAKWMPI